LSTIPQVSTVRRTTSRLKIIEYNINQRKITFRLGTWTKNVAASHVLLVSLCHICPCSFTSHCRTAQIYANTQCH